jgi:hypothetical protein
MLSGWVEGAHGLDIGPAVAPLTACAAADIDL